MKEIKVDTAGERLDVFLFNKFKDYSRSYFQRLIKAEKVTVNNKNVHPSYMVKENDKINVELFLENDRSPGAEDIALDIIYEDDDILVLNKAPGMVVHPACGHPNGTLVNALLGYSKGRFKPFLVHRLDKDTSGVIIAAKNEKAKNKLVRQFQNRKVKKVYLAAVKGIIGEDKGKIDAPLGRSLKDRKKIEVSSVAEKDAVTEFKVITRGSKYCILEVYPHTGRTHQIRSHMVFIGHPILGDTIYGGPDHMDDTIFKRQMLHALKISFIHPRENKLMEFSAKPPADFALFLKKK